ncbi:MAG TPA: hypothetical protein VF139_02640 [Candidatus Polarisedimenticolaceae bacterium]
MKRGVGSLLAALSIVSAQDLFACGDRFIFSGSNSRLERAATPGVLANVLIYRDAETDPTSVMFDPALPEVLAEVGHTPSVADRPDELVESARGADVVLVEYRSAPAVRESIRASGGGSIVVPVLDRAARKNLSAAKREFGVVLNVPASAATLIRAIDRALAAR